MTPVGMFSREVITGENPKLLMMMPLKGAWPRTKPGSQTGTGSGIRPWRRLLIRRHGSYFSSTFSLSLRKKAFIGESGRKIKAIIDHSVEIEPINKVGFLSWAVGHIPSSAALSIWQYLFLIIGTSGMDELCQTYR
jgi:hypothetical protein